ncbi:cell division protein FtsZ [Ferviditalea candida]|uniref:Cell division protein FtsZ n=1 Tax=Ferviditalea candida TaxID=3108399 RepID=A0ABU5ZND9_9BACL|nr:cell division protein FtsZ [Paenibacillaceae bacterium T2]
MESPIRFFKIKQEFAEKEGSFLSEIRRDDICFFRFVGGNTSETDKLGRQLNRLKASGALLIGIFRFPFRFEGKRRMQTAIEQYYRMREICDAVTYLNSDGMMETLKPGTPIHQAREIFDRFEEASVRSIEETIRVSGEMNIDAHDIRSFMKNSSGPVYIRTFEGDSFDEPLKYAISAPYLPQDFTEGRQMIVNIGYTQNVDMLSFQQINLRLNDLFNKAELVKLGSYFINEPGHRFRITLFIHGMQDPFPRPEQMGKSYLRRLWLKRKWDELAIRSRHFRWSPLERRDRTDSPETVGEKRELQA